MKVLEGVLEKRIQCRVSIDNMQFGFMPRKGTTDAIFIMRQVKEKHKAKKKKLYYAFVDLEKEFDRVHLSVVVNIMLSLMSVMSPPPALCNLSARTAVKLCTLGVFAFRNKR